MTRMPIGMANAVRKLKRNVALPEHYFAAKLSKNIAKLFHFTPNYDFSHGKSAIFASA